MIKKLVIWGLIVLMLIAAKVCFFSTMRASVALSQGRFCEIRTNGLYHWVTDRRIPLVYSKNGHEAGRLDFRYSPECYPEAIFPTEDRQNVVCFYETDLTIALFVIELNKKSGPGHEVPSGFFTSSPSIISYTDFALRRCTQEEVAYLKSFIRSCDDAALRSLSVSGLPFLFHAASTKEYLLTRIERLTTPGQVPLAGEIPEVSNKSDQ